MKPRQRHRVAYRPANKRSHCLAIVAIAGGFASVTTALTAEVANAEGGLEVPEAFLVCESCHAYQRDEPPLDGPTLWRVVGRRIASLEGYEYSAALTRIDGRWDRATLDRFLTNPQAFAPGTRMEMGGVRSAASRKEVLDFLETLTSVETEDHADDD